jgi:uncharacterized protein YdeI (YjbR/CyaY-like superfamily)
LELTEYYFKTDAEWREWLHENHATSKGVYLILYKVGHDNESMRWEEAVKVALCYGWIDSTAKSLGDGKRRQYFTTRNPKSVWSAVNKKYVEALISNNLMHESGLDKIEAAKLNGSWTALDTVENGIIPNDLQIQFDKNPMAFANYQNFPPSYRKSYLYWLNQAKRDETRHHRIDTIITLCANNIKSRP